MSTPPFGDSSIPANPYNPPPNNPEARLFYCTFVIPKNGSYTYETRSAPPDTDEARQAATEAGRFALKRLQFTRQISISGLLAVPPTSPFSPPTIDTPIYHEWLRVTALLDPATGSGLVQTQPLPPMSASYALLPMSASLPASLPSSASAPSGGTVSGSLTEVDERHLARGYVHLYPELMQSALFRIYESQVNTPIDLSKLVFAPGQYVLWSAFRQDLLAANYLPDGGRTSVTVLSFVNPVRTQTTTTGNYVHYVIFHIVGMYHTFFPADGSVEVLSDLAMFARQYWEKCMSPRHKYITFIEALTHCIWDINTRYNSNNFRLRLCSSYTPSV